MVSEPWDVVVVPFPFSERPDSKRRPALVLSKTAFNENGHTILAMITTKAHRSRPGDSNIEEHRTAGLNTPCMVRLKIFTLDNRLILKKIGHLSAGDRNRVGNHAHRYLI